MKKILLALLLSCIPAHATLSGWNPSPDMSSTFDHLSGIPAARKYFLGKVLFESHTTAICVYDVPTQGGTPGVKLLLNTDLINPCLLPGKSIIRNGFVDVSTAVNGGTSPTISISSGQNAGDMLAATASSSFGVGRFVLSPAFATASSYIKLANPNTIVNGVNLNAYQPYVTVATATLTSGHFRVFIDYELGE